MIHSELKKLLGAEVNFVRFSYQVDINFIYGDSKYANLQLEAKFELKTKDGVATVDPSNLETLAPIIELLHTKVVQISISDDYQLSLTFDNGTGLHVEPIKKYEAWNLTGDDLPYYVAQGI